MDEFSEIMNHLSENARFALQKADYYSKRYNQGYMGTEHLLMGILAQDTSTGARVLREQGVNLNELEKVQGMVPAEEIKTSLKTRKAVKVIVDNAKPVAPKTEEKTEE